MPFIPRLASALVLALDEGSGAFKAMGSGAAFGGPDTILTANHCLPDEDDRPMAVQFHGVPPTCQVTSRHRNAAADLAILRIKRAPPVDMFADQHYLPPSVEFDEGTDVFAWGFPEASDEEGQFARRFFKGHVQRTVPYSWGQKSYWAVELSFPVPRGLSGGVLAPTLAPRDAIAVATTNFESRLVVDSYEEDTRDGVTNRGRIERVTEYGIGSKLITSMDWIAAALED